MGYQLDDHMLCEPPTLGAICGVQLAPGARE